MSDGTWREEECWACNGYGDQRGEGSRRIYCPWCRGTGLLHEGCHEQGETCDCHLGRDFRSGDDWFEFMGFEITSGVQRAYLPRDRMLREKIEAELAVQHA